MASITVKINIKNGKGSKKSYPNFNCTNKETELLRQSAKKINTTQKMKFSIKDFFSKHDHIRRTCRFGHIY